MLFGKLLFLLHGEIVVGEVGVGEVCGWRSWLLGKLGVGEVAVGEVGLGNLVLGKLPNTLPLTRTEYRESHLRVFIRPIDWDCCSEEVERFEGSSPETLFFPGEIAVHHFILYCYLFRLEYIFNPKLL